MALSTIILEAGGVFARAINQDLSGNIGVNITNTPTVSGPLTNTQLRASAVPVSGTVAVTQGTSPWVVDASGTTVPVSVQNSSIAVTGTFWQATQPVSGTVAVNNFPASGPTDTTTGDAGTHTASFNGATQTNTGYRGAIITVVVSAISGTSPRLVIQPQWSIDGGTIWYDFTGGVAINATPESQLFIICPGQSSASFQCDSVFSVTPGSYSLPKTWRLQYTITGTSPSYTISGVYVNYLI